MADEHQPSDQTAAQLDAGTPNQAGGDVTITERGRARKVVRRHALDDEDAAELLGMLGLLNGQQHSSPPRSCSGQAARRSGRVHALSAATAARLAMNPAKPTNTVGVAPATAPTAPTTVAAPATPATVDESPDLTAAERICEGCGAPVVPQTRYKLDPNGYRERGIRLLAAKGRCWQCYNRLPRPPAADVSKPKTPPRRAKSAPQATEHVAPEPATNNNDELGRWALALVHANRELAEVSPNVAQVSEERDTARAECGRLAGLLEEAAARIAEMQRQVEDVITAADQHFATTAEQARHVLEQWTARRRAWQLVHDQLPTAPFAVWHPHIPVLGGTS